MSNSQSLSLHTRNEWTFEGKDAKGNITVVNDVGSYTKVGIGFQSLSFTAVGWTPHSMACNQTSKLPAFPQLVFNKNSGRYAPLFGESCNSQVPQSWNKALASLQVWSHCRFERCPWMVHPHLIGASLDDFHIISYAAFRIKKDKCTSALAKPHTDNCIVIEMLPASAISCVLRCFS
jgi:hypothetical protein